MPRRSKKASDAASFGQLRDWYTQAQHELDQCRKELKLANALSRETRTDLVETRKIAKTAKSRVITLSKAKKASDEAKQSAAWSGGAAIFSTILYEVYSIIVFPIGGHDPEWIAFWRHEAVNGTILWVTTCVFAYAYRATRRI